MTKTFEIFFSDLTKEVQDQLLKYFNLKDSKEMNWDAFPITEIVMEVAKK